MPQVFRYSDATKEWEVESSDDNSLVVSTSQPLPPARRHTPIVIAAGLAGIAIVVAGVIGLVSNPHAEIAKVKEPIVVSDLPVGIKARMGQLTLGAFAGEAAEVAGIKDITVVGLSDPKVHAVYWQSVRKAYGVDLEEMNYFGIGDPGWTHRLPQLEAWAKQASRFGSVTIALEPIGKDHFHVFHDGPEMVAFRDVLKRLIEARVTVWIRFGSESNISNSDFSVTSEPGQTDFFFDRACWFKKYMPPEIKMVFSPLINTARAGVHQPGFLRQMFQGADHPKSSFVPWDCIGGTLYLTDLKLHETYDWYYRLMSSMNTSLPFQLCELGGPYNRRDEVTGFMKEVAKGQWPRVIRINLFAHQINEKADPSGEFGFMNPENRRKAIDKAKETGKPVFVESWMKSFLIDVATRRT